MEKIAGPRFGLQVLETGERERCEIYYCYAITNHDTFLFKI